MKLRLVLAIALTHETVKLPDGVAIGVQIHLFPS
jgi:hypothetical protein